MNKRLLLMTLMVFSVLLSVSAVCASEITVTDSYADGSDISVSSDLNVGNDSSKLSLSNEEVLESENSNVLSTNMDSSTLAEGTVSTKFIAPDRTINIEDAVNGYDYQVILRDANGNGLAGKEVSFNFNGKTSTGITNSNGWATAKLTSDTSGTYDVEVTFKGDANYAKISQIATIKIIKNEVNFVAPDRTLYLNEISSGYTYPVILRDTEGNPLSKKQVTLIFNGKKLTETTNNRGYCYFNIAVDKAGSYSVGINFDGDQYYYGKSCSNFKTVEVIVKKNVTFIAPDRTLHVEDIEGGYTYPVLLRDSDGNALANKKITLTFNGNKFTGTTNSRGYCYFNLTVNRANSYPITINFAGDKYYYANSALHFKTVNVIKWNVTFIAPDRSVYLDEISGGYIYPVLLRDSNGKALANKKITLTFNGKTLEGTTDNKGYCYFTITANEEGLYKVSLKFAGDRYCNSKFANNFKTVEVIVMKNVVFVAPDRTLYVDEISGGYSYPVLLRDSEGKALANKKITITFNGKKQVQTTDKKGYCYFNINVDKAGSYGVSLDFAGDNYYYPNAATNFRTVKVIRYNTKLVWKSETSFESGYQTVNILLTDANGAALADKLVKLTINSNSYSAKTGANGYATFNLNLNPNTYAVSYSYDGDNRYNPSSGNTKITIISKEIPEGYGYFVFGSDMKNVNLNTLAAYGTTDLFLNYYAIESYGKSSVESWIASANRLGIRVHIWMQVYYDGEWHNPIDTSFSNKRIAEAKEYASINGVSGILFDYLRYPGTAYKTSGGTEAISKFTKLVTEEIHKINSNIIVSAALMPETTVSDYYYGQDYSALSTYLDAVLPMIYKGNYNKGSSWVGSTTKWYVDNSKGAAVWTTLQSYRSDDDVSKIPSSELIDDVNIALNAGASGVILFRYGLTNIINFTNLDPSADGDTSISINDILTGAVNLKSYYEKNKALPSTVTVSGNTFTVSEFLYLMSQAIYQLGSSNTNPINCIYGVKSAASSVGDDINAQLVRSGYLDLAKRVADYIKANNQAPNFASSSVGKISYTVLVESSARILAFYKNNDRYMPNYVTIVQSASDVPSVRPTSISIDDILTGAVNLKTYYEKNNALPATITAAGYAFKAQEFLYLMDQAIYQLGSSNTNPITCIYDVQSAASSSGDNINAQLDKSGYLDVAKRVADYIKANNQAPNFASSSVGKISYTVLVESSARILAFYKNNDRNLPNYVTIKEDSSSPDITPSRVNVINTITDLTPYYQATKNCQVNNAQIKAIVNSLTSGLTNDKDKAVAIYNYVRDQISYSYYYDTKYGAVGTLNAKTGNCVDQAHLLVAMYRTAGLAARYEHGTCYFPLSGSTYGHVWTQVLIGNMWTVGDPTSNRNSFGVVNNWNTNSYTHNGYYASLPF